ncbi:DUF1287 domain-containing protein [Butyrivibrio sp. NC2002]|uniref:DUF1287 domain-containing protein n=1 Tax=Butyrivibrio sp. NC2002 TaxID=1410610 RepID=UPI00069083AF|nr:DUF1287 domain-containing protein [Butyrivibrio sp. NC2002]
MTIKDVEEQLGIDRANIRFYESKGLIKPARERNGYRNYSNEDIETLKKVIILRKMGLSIDDISELQNGKSDLQGLVENNLNLINEKMQELNGSLLLCKDMQTRNENYSNMSIDYYWDEINNKEQSGIKFEDIIRDSLEYEKNFFLSSYGWSEKGLLRTLFDDEPQPKKKSMLTMIVAIVVFLWFAIILGMISKNNTGYFLPGFLVFVIIFLLESVIMHMFRKLMKKKPEQKKSLLIKRGICVLLVTPLILGLYFSLYFFPVASKYKVEKEKELEESLKEVMGKAYVEIKSSSVDKDEDGIDDLTDIVDNAERMLMEDWSYGVHQYDGGYPTEWIGTSADVVTISLRDAGYDIRKQVNEDIIAHPEAYSVDTPNIDMDFRDIDVLNIFFSRNAIKRTTDLLEYEDWQPGDIVFFSDEIGILSYNRDENGILSVIYLPKAADTVCEWDTLAENVDIIARYRISE